MVSSFSKVFVNLYGRWRVEDGVRTATIIYRFYYNYVDLQMAKDLDD